MAHNGRMLGVIGGSGFYSFFGSDARAISLDTPYGSPSAPITVGAVGDHEVAFLPRHGVRHEFSPHTVPYRANMWAMRALGVRRIFAPCAVGSLTPRLGPGAMVVIQGPRFSTRAESRWFASQGFTLVNMTGYPEAVLARELEMCYAAIALVTDLDAGIESGEGVRAVDVFAEFEKNLVPFKKLVHEAIDQVAVERTCTLCLPHDGVELPFDLP